MKFKKINKKLILKAMFSFIFLFIIIIINFNIGVKAEFEEDYGQEKIISALPDDARNKISDMGITPGNKGALSLSPAKIFRWLLDLLKKEAAKPLKMLAAITAVILLCSLAESLRDSAGNAAVSQTFGIVAVLAGAGMMCGYVAECLNRTNIALHAGGTFFLTFIPVFAGIMAVTGQITTGAAFNGVIIIASQIFSYIMLLILSPLCAVVLGMTITGAVNPDLKISEFSEVIKKLVIWILGFMLAIFVGLLSLQTFVSASADTVAMKTAKFVLSNSVPIVGNAISDALSAIKDSFDLLRASTGTFGIIAGVAIILPPIISVLCYKIALGIAVALCEIFGARELNALLKSGENIVTIMFAMMLSFLVLAIVSISLMLFISRGG